MGSYRFRLSDMMPNAWFYKLKDMGKIRNRNSNTTHSTKKKQASAAPTTTVLAPSKPKTHNSYPRKSYYFTRELVSTDKKFHNTPINSKPIDAHFLVPPRKSSKQRIRRSGHTKSSPKLVSSSVSAGCSCRTKSDSPPDYAASFSDSSLDQEQDFYDSFPSELRSDSVLTTDSFDKMESPWSRSSCGCKLDDSNDNDVVISVDKKSLACKMDILDAFDHISNLDLPPIITKPSNFDQQVEEINEKKAHQEPTKYRRSSATHEESNSHGSFSLKVVKEDCIAVKEHKPNNSVRRQHSVTSPGVKLRVHSPRISNRKIQAYNGRKSVSSTASSGSRSRRTLPDSLAIVKSSCDPQRDFRESMVEMIVQNNIRASKDLEDLLACYLSLNSDEYHDLIIKVFKQIWFDLTDIKVKSSIV